MERTYRNEWPLDPQVAMLNHGSFGACPRRILEIQQSLRDRLEAEPVRFFARELEPLLEESRETLAGFLHARGADLVFLRNATLGVNAVLRSLEFKPGDEILVTDHAYNACRNAVEFMGTRQDVRVVVASIPLPIGSPREVVDTVLARVGPRTRLAMLDHVTSPTGLVFPIGELVRELDRRGVDTLVDGAHAPGMVPLDLEGLGAAYYTGNCHKWLCAPKGAGFLHVRGDRQEGIHPAAISHGWNTFRAGRPRLQDAFDWTGTDDPTPWLCVGHAIRFLDGLAGGFAALMTRNRALALEARGILGDAVGSAPLCPEEMIGSMAAVRLPDDPDLEAARCAYPTTPAYRLQRELLDRFGVEVPLYYWPAPPQRLVRVSAQAYNQRGEYCRLADALRALL